MKKFEKLEKIIFAVSFIGLVLTGQYLFFSDVKVKKVQTHEDKNIGFVKPIGPDVRLRGKTDVSWSKINNDTSVFKSDKVFTGSKSTALVNLKSKQKFTIEPSSLVVINDENENVYIDLDSGGGFLGEIKKGVKFIAKKANSRIEIESNGANISLSSRNGNEIKLVVLSGQASVKTQEKEEVLNVEANSELKVKENKVAVVEIPIELISPKPGEIIFSETKKQNFQWASKVFNPKSEYRIIVAKDPLFEEIIYDKKVQGTSVEMDIQTAPSYFWKVVSLDETLKTSKLSATSSFSVYDLLPPRIQSDASLDVELDWRGVVKDPIEFTWNDPSISDEYIFQLSRKNDFSELIFDEKTLDKKIAISDLKNLEYFWRVISVNPLRKKLISNIGRLVINEKVKVQENLPQDRKLAQEEALSAEEKPAEVNVAEKQEVAEVPPIENIQIVPPKLIEKNYQFELVSTNDISHAIAVAKGFQPIDRPTLSWPVVEGVDGYQVKVSLTNDFNTIVVDETVIDSNWKWMSPLVGHFYFKIIAFKNTAGAKQTAESEVYTLRTILEPPTNVLLKSVDDPELAHSSIMTKWKTHALSSKIEVQVSDSKEFSNVLKTISNSNDAEILLDQAGMMFVRARHLNAKGWPISSFSKTMQIQVTPPKPKKVELPILADEKVDANNLQIPNSKINEVKILDEADTKYFNNSIFLSLGVDFISLNQKRSDGYDTGDFARYMFPSVLLGGQFNLADRYNLDFEYSNQPGKINAGSSVILNQNSFNLKTMLIDLRYRISSNDLFIYSLLFGLQSHELPFLYTNLDGSVDLLQNSLTNASVGFSFLNRLKNNYSIEGLIHYQYPISTRQMNGSSISVSSAMIFDAGVGVSKSFKENYNVGLVLKYQQTQFKYDFYREGINSNGTQTLNNSNLLLRLKYDF